MSFNWQTEEDWDDLSSLEEPESPTPRCRWLYVLAVVLVLAVAAGGIWWRLNQRVDEVSADLIGDVTASLQLVRRAVEVEDAELFTSLLSGRDATWAEQQQTLMQEGLYLNRSDLGMEWQPGSSSVLDVSLSADLQEATVQVSESYEVSVGNGISTTVRMQREETYRLGDARWLLAHPAGGMDWGETLTHVGPQLTLSYPEKDMALAERIANDLDRKIAEACDPALGAVCTPEAQLEVVFTTNLSLLADMRSPLFTLAGDARIIMPAPSLVGIPRDEAGYNALFRGYATPIVSRFLAQASGYRCCRHVLFFQALLDRQLAQLGLKPWPLAPDHYRLIFESDLVLRNVNEMWQITDPAEARPVDSLQAHIVTDYLLFQHPNLTAAMLQRSLMEAGSYWEWLNLHVSADLETLDRS